MDDISEILIDQRWPQICPGHFKLQACCHVTYCNVAESFWALALVWWRAIVPWFPATILILLCNDLLLNKGQSDVI